ncbi:MAG: tetratricopeptide repeat protein [Candidatus Eisenbacteria bacterium]|nr:tetratricopeptide repeat protein [Candidatus Eisenbacteria bacterium]
MPADIRTCVTGLVAAALVAALVVSSPAEPTAREAVARARALERSGRPDEARTYLSELTASDDRLAEEASVLLELARLTADVDTLTTLLDAALDAARRPEEIAAAHMMRGDLLFARGRYTAAAEEYARADRSAPAFRPGAAEFRRAESLLAARDGSAALDAFTTIAEAPGTLEEIRPRAELGAARALLELGRHEEAARSFEKVAAEYPDGDVRLLALSGAAEARAQIGDHAAATELLSSLVEEYPGTFHATLALERLSRPAPPDTASADTTSPSNESR